MDWLTWFPFKILLSIHQNQVDWVQVTDSLD